MKKRLLVIVSLLAIVGPITLRAEKPAVTNDTMQGWTLDKAKKASGECPDGFASYEWWMLDTKALVFRKNGRLNGPILAWYPSGRRWMEGQFIDGQKVGLWRYWDQEGKVLVEGEYRDGKPWNGQFRAGDLFHPAVWSNGVEQVPRLK